MKTTFELDHFVTTSVPTCYAYRAHYRLRARTNKPDTLNATMIVDYEFCENVLLNGRCSKGSSIVHCIMNGFGHFGMCMPQNKRSPRGAQIHILVTIGIPNMTALSFHNKSRSATYRSKCTHRRIYSSREIGFGFFKKSSRFCGVHLSC